MICNRSHGFTYIGILIAVALTSVGLAAIGELWRTAAQREKERELLFIGDEIRRAITSYYDSTPGIAKQFPKNLNDLLRDPRYPVVRRHLRKIYADPMTGRPDWGIVPGPGDTIMGVHSQSEAAPIKRANFAGYYRYFEKAERYADWTFVYSGARVVRAGAAPGALSQQASAQSATSSTSAPAAAAAASQRALAPPPVPRPKPRPQNEEDDPHKKTCGILAQNDNGACQAAAMRHGAAVGDACQGSAQVRYSQCLARGPLPLLVLTP